jgi:uncharacterized membrane protein AbrB (regulator of aidB expression)
VIGPRTCWFHLFKTLAIIGAQMGVGFQTEARLFVLHNYWSSFLFLFLLCLNSSSYLLYLGVCETRVSTNASKCFGRLWW